MMRSVVLLLCLLVSAPTHAAEPGAGERFAAAILVQADLGWHLERFDVESAGKDRSRVEVHMVDRARRSAQAFVLEVDTCGGTPRAFRQQTIAVAKVRRTYEREAELYKTLRGKQLRGFDCDVQGHGIESDAGRYGWDVAPPWYVVRQHLEGKAAQAKLAKVLATCIAGAKAVNGLWSGEREISLGFLRGQVYVRLHVWLDDKGGVTAFELRDSIAPGETADCNQPEARASVAALRKAGAIERIEGDDAEKPVPHTWLRFTVTGGATLELDTRNEVCPEY